MKIHLTLFVILLFILTVRSRNVDEIELDELSGLSEEKLISKPKERGGNIRQRRKRWQFGYGLNYPPPPPPYFDRRDDRNQQDLLPQILALLDEISAYLKRPQSPPPQPIYVPYPVPYPVPQYQCSCPSTSNANTTKLPSIDQRWPVMDDTNQNWGFVEPEEASDGGGDGSRPITFDRIIPIQTMKRPQPSVEHGSTQAGIHVYPRHAGNGTGRMIIRRRLLARNDLTTQNPLSVKGLSQSSAPRKPSRCDAAVLSCCGPSSTPAQQRKCFSNLGCDAYYIRGDSCASENVSRVLDSFTKSYSVL